MNTRRKALFILPIMILGLIYSCGPTVKVTNDYDRSVDFSQYKTFAVYDLKAQEGQMSQLNADRVTNAIRVEMINKGFKEVTSNPDLKVNAVTILKDKKQVTSNSDFYGYGGMYRPYGYWGGGMVSGTTRYNTYDYVDGSLIIDIVSSKTQKLVWQGIGNTEFDKRPDNPDEFINSSVKKILAGFPPGLVAEN
ncbi:MULTISPECIES: DUF4136 domain-containing protein [unclassified Flavobacterium]|uniref:DUF4136 domain-containing protein n=1 Tax=unclassified Flavobacterium TaxID=196869 RepID=UPI000F0C75AA|nr:MULTISPECIES: DUF4136 domain-containing protein [unclassified Flavobacterium]AYN05699.1 DUF4136 domain-containing protein [Flavobacterium sp. 140616W15]MCD0474284.1 DUF4136 domain-containing protein [Flavobacterium sp. EDS]